MSFLPGFALTPDIAVRLVLSLCVLFAGFLDVVRERASPSSISFFVLTIAIWIWIFGSALVLAAADPAVALAIARRFTHLGVAFIPSLMLFFVLRRMGLDRRYAGAVLACFGFSLLSYVGFMATPWLIPAVHRFWWGYVPEFSPVALGFIGFFCAVFVVSGIMLVRAHRSALTRTHEKRTSLFLIGLGVSCFAILDFVPAYGVPLYQFGCFAIIGLVFAASRVAIRFPFWEITPANLGGEIMETMTEGFLVLDLQGNVRLANEAAARIFNTPIHSLAGRAAAEVPGLERLPSHFPAVLERGTETFDTVLSGSEAITARLSASAIHDRNGEATAIVCRVRDMTENVKDKAALRYEQNLLRTLIDNLPVAVYVKDAACRKMLANPVDISWMMELRPDGDVIGKTDFDIYPKDVADGFYADDQLVIRSGKPLVDREESYRDKNGTVKWLLTSKIPLFDDSGAVVGLVGTGRDITERKRAEQILMASLKEKDLLLQEVHHRVKNNLQIVCSLISLQRHKEDGSAETGRALTDMESRIRSMALVHGILYQSEDISRVDFSAYIKRLCEHLVATYAIDSSRVRLDVAVKDVSLTMEKAIPCGLIVNELVTNAIKHAFPNGRHGAVHVEMSRRENSMVSLIVRDDGVGDAQPREQSNEKKTIGLSIVESLVKQLKGRYEIRGTDGMLVEAVFPA